MRGGSVFVAAGNYQISVGQTGSLALQPVQNGLQDMLTSYGITVENKLVLDTQNTPFPIQVQRNAGADAITETQAVNYPQFVDVRSNGMDSSNPSVARLQLAANPPILAPIRIVTERFVSIEMMPIEIAVAMYHQRTMLPISVDEDIEELLPQLPFDAPLVEGFAFKT